MRATTEDFRKVMDVTKEQIVGALKTIPLSMEEYKKSLKTYNEINESRKEEAKMRGEREGKAIHHLRAMITPEILELIQRDKDSIFSRPELVLTSTRGKTGRRKGENLFSPNSAQIINHFTTETGMMR